ncbi:hypothetical protein [Xenorhabdus bovienii]|uniref:hypothetical protein n=1 Tax=Xenorhabdus bovienii TaxID=40576 RepID=UPI0012D345A5|nr:hypothetical protein [Xenorhabdus bovienii]
MATITAWLTGGGITLSIIVVTWSLNSNHYTDCHNESGGIYESNSKLCYNDNVFTTLENKSNGKAVAISSFTVLGKDRAIIYTQDNGNYFILFKDNKLEISPYEEHEQESLNNSSDFDNAENVTKISCYDNYMTDPYDGFIFPKHNSTLYSVENLVCYKGRDITSWVAGHGMKVTAAVIPNPKELFAIVTIEEENPQQYESKSSIRTIYITSDGVRGKRDIFTQRYTQDPKKTLSKMKIVGYNYEKGIVYFSVPAWAVSHAIHAFTIPFDNNYNYVREKFITDGDLTFVNMSNLSGNSKHDKYIGSLVVEQSEIREGEGRVYNEYLISPEGKRICELDTEVENWRIYLPCKK